jgi:hypothetical protein
MTEEEEIAIKFGAVSFLDVLGMKGIWQQDDTALEKLHGLIQETIRKSEEISRDYLHFEEFKGQEEITKVISISDTIAMFTPGDSEKTIEIQAKICSWLLGYALLQGIPLRGAISYGEYMTKENIMLGYAVDEAASWHETTDWIGVILSPSAHMKTKEKGLEAIIKYDHIPFKKTEKFEYVCRLECQR